MDQRIQKLADLLLDYCVELKEGQTALVNTTTLAEPIVKALIAGAAKRGAYLIPLLKVEDSQYLFYDNATEELLDNLGPVDKLLFENADAMIAILANHNSKELTRVEPSKIARTNKSRRILHEILNEREMKGEFKWVVAPFPVSPMAADAEMSLEEFTEFVYRACACDSDDPAAHWRKIHDEQELIVKQFDGSKKLHIVGKDTDLTMSVDGRKWINCDGKRNMPDGEIFTSPVEDSAEGTIYFDYPASYRGVEVEGVRLWLEGGKVVKATAEKGEAYLLKLLDTDEGSRLVGEIAIGTNFNVQSPTKSILFDEKIGGSMHMAVGMSIPEAGGKNMSGLHWDLIKDMRDGGRWELDGKVVYENGEFKI